MYFEDIDGKLKVFIVLGVNLFLRETRLMNMVLVKYLNVEYCWLVNRC